MYFLNTDIACPSLVRQHSQLSRVKYTQTHNTLVSD